MLLAYLWATYGKATTEVSIAYSPTKPYAVIKLKKVRIKLLCLFD